MTNFVPIKEVAETLGVSVHHIRKLLWKKVLPASTYIKVGQAYRFDLAALIEFFRDDEAQAVDPEDDGDDEDSWAPVELDLEPDETTPIPDVEFDDYTEEEPAVVADFDFPDNDEDY